MKYIKDGFIILIIYLLPFIIMGFSCWVLYTINETFATWILSSILILGLAYIVGKIVNM